MSDKPLHSDPVSHDGAGVPQPALTPPEQAAVSRRAFLGTLGGAAAMTAAAGSVLTLPAIVGTKGSEALAEVGPLGPHRRKNQALRVRVNAALTEWRRPLPGHPDNGDENRYPNKIASFSKGLPHDLRGEVNPAAYESLLTALRSGRPEDFENIIMGCVDSTHQMKLVNPQAGLAFDMQGSDSHAMVIPAAPRFDSAEEAGEIVENYWMALLRDVPFTQYESSGVAQQAAADLSSMSDFRGPKEGGLVTPRTLFRDGSPGTLIGPYISQFMLKPMPYGAGFIEQRMRTPLPGSDFMAGYGRWLDIQNGCVPFETIRFDPVRRLIRNGRDLGQWVHVDVLYQAYFQAMLILLTPPDPTDSLIGGGIGAPLNAGNPYLRSRTQDGFGTFGGPFIATIVPEVATRALKAQWFQKWYVHRRLRPEAFGGRVHNKIRRNFDYPIHPDALSSLAVQEVHRRFGSYLLPMAYPEGCPPHPAYGAGHATVAGACVTILKALFDESFVVPNPVVPDADGQNLVPYTGADAGQMTVGGELNKLAANVAYGRNIAGVHWRTDGVESLKLGEEVAISVLRDQRGCYNEAFEGFTFTKFDGTQVTV